MDHHNGAILPHEPDDEPENDPNDESGNVPWNNIHAGQAVADQLDHSRDPLDDVDWLHGEGSDSLFLGRSRVPPALWDETVVAATLVKVMLVRPGGQLASRRSGATDTGRRIGRWDAECSV